MNSLSPNFDPTPVFPNGQTTTHTHHSHLLATVLLVVGIIMIICIGVGAYALIHPKILGLGTGIVPQGYQLFISSRAAPYQQVIAVDASSGIAQPYSVVAQGTARLVGIAMSGTSTPYYLISDPQLTVSNLYAGNAKNPKAGLAQLTNSQTFKYDLSYDASSGVAAYTVAESGSSTPHVMLYSPLTKKETDLGVGTDPTVMPGGNLVLYRDGGTSIVAHTAGNQTYTLMSIPANAPFAVDSTKNLLALYDPTAHSIQYFSIVSKITASSALTSIKIIPVPSALVFVNHSLLMSYFSLGGTAKNPQPEVMLQYVGGPREEPVIFSAKAPMPVGSYRLTAQM